MTERQIDIINDLSICQRKIGYAQGVLESIDSQAKNKAIEELQYVSTQLISQTFDIFELMELLEGDEQND